MSDVDGRGRVRHVMITCPRCGIRQNRSVRREIDPLCKDCRSVDNRFPRKKINASVVPQ